MDKPPIIMKLTPKPKSTKPEKSPTARALARARSNPDPDQAVESSVSKLAQAADKEPAVRKVVRASKRLADRLDETNRERAKEVLVDAMEASGTMFDPEAKALRNIPDHKTRLAAATLVLAYDEGLPVKRTVTLTGDFQTADQLIDRLRSSPEALRAIMGAGVKIEVAGEVIEGEFSPVETKQNPE